MLISYCLILVYMEMLFNVALLRAAAARNINTLPSEPSCRLPASTASFGNKCIVGILVQKLTLSLYRKTVSPVAVEKMSVWTCVEAGKERLDNRSTKYMMAGKYIRNPMGSTGWSRMNMGSQGTCGKLGQEHTRWRSSRSSSHTSTQTRTVCESGSSRLQ